MIAQKQVQDAKTRVSLEDPEAFPPLKPVPYDSTSLGTTLSPFLMSIKSYSITRFQLLLYPSPCWLNYGKNLADLLFVLFFLQVTCIGCQGFLSLVAIVSWQGRFLEISFC